MSVQKYNEARIKALKILSLGLVFLFFLPVGIPASLIIMPFLAGRIGAKELPKNWHTTYIITVGGGWSLGLIAAIFVLLSLALGPALRINTIEPIIFGLMIIFNWASFAIGVNSSKGLIQDVEIYQTEWEEEENSEEKTDMAISQEESLSASEKLKQLFKSTQKNDNEMKEATKPADRKVTKTKKYSKRKKKDGRVNALASRRRK